MTAVIFDLDGTLVESAPAIRDIANTLMRELSLATLDLADTRSYIGNGAGVFLRRALLARNALDDATFPVLLDKFLTLYGDAPGDANPAMPGVDRALSKLARRGCKLAVCTNKPEIPTLAVLDALGWGNRFPVVIAGDTLTERKPHPAPLLEAARRLDGAPVFYVGDSEVDAATAQAAEIPFILYTQGYRNAPVDELHHAAALSDFSNLPGLVTRLAGEQTSLNQASDGGK